MALGLAVLGACTDTLQVPRTQAQEQPERPTLLLVSLDGFRWDFMELADTPALDRLAVAGVRAERLIPVFPTKTFPNHYTIVTGLYPEHHGIVANNFHDPALAATFVLADPTTHTLAPWWEGEPIWVTAEKQGRATATYFWPGSEAEIEGIRPTYWRPYDQGTPYDERIDQVLAWLDSAEQNRPEFIALYLDLVDTVAHSYDPDSSAQVAEAIHTVDSALGRLLDGISTLGLMDRLNLIVVSDHGMAATSPARVIFLDDYLDLDKVRIVDWDPVLSIWPDVGEENQVYESLVGAHPHLRVFRREEIPAAWHYRNHRRIPPLLGVADEGWSISTRQVFTSNPGFFAGGNHGYEPSLTSMGALFVARGPAFQPGLVVPPVEAVDLYELMCRILALTPAPNDGDPERVQHIVRY